jgi:hypothetical protein
LTDQQNISEENRFWLQILGDHSRFILDSLSPRETSETEKAEAFIKLFDELLAKARQRLSGEDQDALNKQAFAAAQDLRVFKLHLLSRQLTQEIQIDLNPEFINHMINELEEYLYILDAVLHNQPFTFHPVHLHIVWMLDGSGHAATIADRLSSNYKDTKNLAEMFASKFSAEHEKALEMGGYLRTGLTDFPALKQLNADAEFAMKNFMGFLMETEKQVREKNILSILAPLMLNHMYREECYYLSQLSMVSQIEQPDCNPAGARVE